MSDCCAQLKGELQAIKSQLANLNNQLGQKANKSDVPKDLPGQIRKAIADAIPAIVGSKITDAVGIGIKKATPGLQDAVLGNLDELIGSILRRQGAPVLGGKEGAIRDGNAQNIRNWIRAQQAGVSKLQSSLDGLSQKLSPLTSRVGLIANLASLAVSLGSAGISIGNLVTMIKRLNQIDKVEGNTLKALSDTQTQIGTLNTRTKNLQAADIKLDKKIEQALDKNASNEKAIQKVAEDTAKANGTANTALIQARRAETNITGINTKISQLSTSNQSAINQLASRVASTQDAVNRTQSTASSAQNTANRALTQSSSNQNLINNIQNTANRALSTAQQSLTRPLQQAVNNVTNVVNNTIVNPIRERVTNTVQTVREVRNTHTITNTVQTVREVKTNTVTNTIKEVEVIDPQTKAAIQRIEANTVSNAKVLQQTNTTLAQVDNKTTALDTKTTNIQNGMNDVKSRVTQTQNKVNEVSSKMKERFDKLANRLKLPEIINALTLIVVLHNAAMLSKNLLETLGEIISVGLSVIGLKDEEGQAIDINKVLGIAANDFIVSILGQGVWSNLVAKWKSASRVYQSAANIVYTIRSLGDSTREVLEWTAENTGKIGNALKKNRVVAENSYPWMPENVKSEPFARKRLGRMVDGLENLDDAASSLSSVTGEVANVAEEVGQLREQQQKFEKDIKDAESKFRPDNEPTKTAAKAADNVSKSPAIAATDLASN